MSEKESPQKVIEAHRKRQMRQGTPIAVMIGAGILLVAGAAALIFWLLGSNSPFKDSTPTPTITQTPTMTSTATSMPTDTPTITPTSAPSETPLPSITPTPSGPFEYTVQQGDSGLGMIAAKFGTDIPTILALNPSIDPATLTIYIGQKILIPAPNTLLPTATPVSTNVPPGTIILYTVMSGDTVGAIAVKFNSTVDAIVKENKLANANDIAAGVILKIPVNIATPVPTATVGTVYPTANVPTNTPIVPTSTRIP